MASDFDLRRLDATALAQGPEGSSTLHLEEPQADVRVTVQHLPQGTVVSMRVKEPRAEIIDGYCQGCGCAVPGLAPRDSFGYCSCDAEEDD